MSPHSFGPVPELLMLDSPALVAAIAGSIAIGGIVMLAPILYRRSDEGAYGWRVAFWKLFVVLYSRIWCRLRVRHLGTIPTEGPVILAANHTVSIDPLLLSAVCPKRTISFLIAREFAGIPVFRRLVEMLDCIPVDRNGLDASAARRAMRRIRQGRILGIFPEGRISRPGETLDPKEGVALLALRTGAPVVPIFIGGTVYSDAIFRPFFLLHRVCITIGPAVDLSRFRDTARDRATVSAAADEIMRCIRALNDTTRNKTVE